MEACPRPLHHDDAYDPLIKNPESIIKNVLQLANGAKQKTKAGKIQAGTDNRNGKNKDKLIRLLSYYVNAIRTG